MLVGTSVFQLSCPLIGFKETEIFKMFAQMHDFRKSKQWIGMTLLLNRLICMVMLRVT